MKGVLKNKRLLIFTSVFLLLLPVLVSAFDCKAYVYLEDEVSAKDLQGATPIALDQTVTIKGDCANELIWYAFTPKFDGRYTISTFSVEDSYISIYSKKDTATYSEMKFNDVSRSQSRSKCITVNLEQDQTYYICPVVFSDRKAKPVSLKVEAHKDIEKIENVKFTSPVVGYDNIGRSVDYYNIGLIDFTEVFTDGTKLDCHYPVNIFSITDMYYNKILFTSTTANVPIAFNMSKAGTYEFTMTFQNDESKDKVSVGKYTLKVLSAKEYLSGVKELPLNQTYDIETTNGYSRVYKFTPKQDGVYRIKRTSGNKDYMFIDLMDYRANKNKLAMNYGTTYQFFDQITEGAWNLKKGTTYYFLISNMSKETIYLDVVSQYIPVASVSIAKSATVKCDDLYNLSSSLTYTPKDASITSTAWSSSNPKVATVKNGMVTACGYGTAVITVTMDGKSASCIINVPSPAVGSTFVVDQATYKITKAGLTGGMVAFIEKQGAKKSISIPKTVTSKGISYKVNSVGNSALKNNKKITKLTIGANVTKIGKNAFSGCTKLKNISIKTNKLKAKTVGKNAFAKVKAKIKVPAKKLKSYKAFLFKKGLSKKSKITK